MTKLISQLKTPTLYLVCIAALLLLGAALKPSATVFAWYFCASFWALVVFDYMATQLRNAPTRFAFEDRFIGYLFAAPLIWPARFYTLWRALPPSRS